ncbi:GTPase regulator Nrf1 [Malassezia sp. CBS 17886]|nr:GTPase regulator Nrf1 [Malassezia sp. CBS 17886]
MPPDAASARAAPAPPPAPAATEPRVRHTEETGRLARVFPSAAELDRDDLHTLLADSTDPQTRDEQNAYFDAFFHSLPEVQAMYNEHVGMLEQVEKSAARNEQLRPTLMALRDATRDAYEHAHALETRWPAVERDMQEAYKTRLQMQTNTLHDESEALANSYVEGLPPPTATHGDVLDDTAFVREYREQRTRYHRRALHLALNEGMSTQPLLQRTAGKRIALPVRVEPKVFFANERTFLSWLSFTVTLSALAAGLLNFGDRVGRVSAALFSFVAIAIMIYALVTYHWRAQAIRNRGSGPYDDRLGPTILSVLLLTAIIVNFVLRFNELGAQ